MKRMLVLVVLIALTPIVNTQQIPKLMDSAQKHWTPVSGPEAGLMGHLHVDCDDTDRPQVSTFLRVNCVLTLFHTSAQITQYYGGNYKTNDAFDWLWDDTGTSTAPIMIGDPAGVKSWNVHFSVKPNIPHGWEWVTLKAYAKFFDRIITEQLSEPIYSIVDITKTSPNDDDPAAKRAQAVGTVAPDPSHPEISYGEETAQFDTLVPRGLLTGITPMTGSTYGYGERFLPPATAEFRADMDLHHGLDGTLIASYQELDHDNGLIHASMNFDADFLSSLPCTGIAVVSGNNCIHRLAIRRIQLNGNEQSAELLVIHATTLNGNVLPPPPQPEPVLPILIGPANLYKFPDGSFHICGDAHCVTTN